MRKRRLSSTRADLRRVTAVAPGRRACVTVITAGPSRTRSCRLPRGLSASDGQNWTERGPQKRALGDAVQKHLPRLVSVRPRVPLTLS